MELIKCNKEGKKRLYELLNGTGYTILEYKGDWYVGDFGGRLYARISIEMIGQLKDRGIIERMEE